MSTRPSFFELSDLLEGFEQDPQADVRAALRRGWAWALAASRTSRSEDALAWLRVAWLIGAYQQGRDAGLRAANAREVRVG